MACAMSCCSFASGPGHGTRPDSDAHVTEKHYGCYKAGIFFALAVILLLLVGCLPVFLLTTNNNLVLLILLITLLLIGLVTFVYFRWQRNRALAMRRTYEQQKFTLSRVHQPVPTPATMTAPMSMMAATTDPASNGTAMKGLNPTAMYPPYTGQNSATKLHDPSSTMTPGGGKDDSSVDGTLQQSIKSPPRYSFI
ncbi:uncharacterized protein LOC128729774 [Anopheles nili]|uniref:uncharacterized protein LOC128729774 n=1 Tax=Anopheles nili TaxID=185578 RepID=UPI00237B6E02|nr:uncharacterized protein LOC128729774 [Anopheles nili]